MIGIAVVGHESGAVAVIGFDASVKSLDDESAPCSDR